MVRTLRTTKIYPIRPSTDDIAKTVNVLYALAEDEITELFFCDSDVFCAEQDLDE